MQITHPCLYHTDPLLSHLVDEPIHVHHVLFLGLLEQTVQCDVRACPPHAGAKKNQINCHTVITLYSPSSIPQSCRSIEYSNEAIQLQILLVFRTDLQCTTSGPVALLS